MLVGSDGLGWIDFDDFALAESVGVIALALILFEGGLTAGWGEIRPVLRPALSLALAGTLITAVVTGFAASWLFDFSHARGAAARLDRRLDGRRGGLLAAARRRPAAAAGAHARGRGRLQRPDRGAARARLHRVGSSIPDYGVARHARCCSCSSSGSASSPGWPSAGCSRWAFQRDAALDARPLPGRVARGGGARRSAPPPRCTARASSPSTSPGSRSAPADIPAKRTVTAFHEGLAWVAQLGMFLTLGLLVFPSRARRGRREGDAARARRRLRRAGRSRPWSRTSARASASREQALLGWAGLRGAVPVVLATFPVLDGRPADPDEFFNIVFFAVLLSTCSRARRSSPSRAGSA